MCAYIKKNQGVNKNQEKRCEAVVKKDFKPEEEKDHGIPDFPPVYVCFNHTVDKRKLNPIVDQKAEAIAHNRQVFDDIKSFIMNNLVDGDNHTPESDAVRKVFVDAIGCNNTTKSIRSFQPDGTILTESTNPIVTSWEMLAGLPAPATPSSPGASAGTPTIDRAQSVSFPASDASAVNNLASELKDASIDDNEVTIASQLTMEQIMMIPAMKKYRFSQEKADQLYPKAKELYERTGRDLVQEFSNIFGARPSFTSLAFDGDFARMADEALKDAPASKSNKDGEGKDADA